MTKVKCTVDSCEFWGVGQVCNAGEIWVKNDITGDPKDFANHFINAANVEFGGDYMDTNTYNPQKNRQPVTARTSPQTCCDTMKLKHSGS